MVPFYSKFPDLAVKETRTVRTFGDADIPDGEYGFIEHYCDEPGCDCRRVLINVMTPDTGQMIWATMTFGWESGKSYQCRLSNTEDGGMTKGPSLDPLNPQTKYAPALLRLFALVLTDPAYVERLKRHYQLFKGSVQGVREYERRQRYRKRGKQKRRK